MNFRHTKKWIAEDNLQADFERESREQELFLGNLQQVEDMWYDDEDRLDHVKRSKWNMLDDMMGI